jgi:hypothetical protein
VREIPTLVCLTGCLLITAACSRRPALESAELAPQRAALRIAPAASRPADDRHGVALVELFTSEGCSSCPPADANLARIADRAGVFALSFHVDYWNYLGWRDPWSDARWSGRQQRYARRLGTREVYTPQLVVNGVAQLLGSDAAGTDEAIASARATPAAVRLWLSVRRGTGREAPASGEPGELVVEWRVDRAPAGAVLELAAVRRQAADRVARGENQGRTLAHVNVVRQLVDERLGGRSRGTRILRQVGADAGLVVGWVDGAPPAGVLGAAAAAVE